MERCNDCLRWRGGGGVAGISAAGAEDGGQAGEDEDRYQIRVDGFQIARRGRHVVYSFTVSRGDASWPLRRRFRQVVALHAQLLQGFGRSAERRQMPSLPPRVTCRSLLCGQHDERFLAARAARLQAYFEQLLRFIPYIDQSEVLREFLCSVDVSGMSYDALLDLGQAIGRGGGPQGVAPEDIEALPQRRPGTGLSPASSQSCCVICRETMGLDEDIRVLPCGHEYHYKCIAQWISQNNKCCVCQGIAVLPRELEAAESGK